MKKLVVMFSAFTFCSSVAFAENYVVPPSSSTASSVPVISDAAMESCVKLYNEAKWLADELTQTQVNEYSSASVAAYNAKVEQHSAMTNEFNFGCAGKQSESAYKAAQKLNQQGQ